MPGDGQGSYSELFWIMLFLGIVGLVGLMLTAGGSIP
jgi:hypothetical protein